MFFQKKAPILPEDVPTLLVKAKAEQNPRKRYLYLSKALKLAPDDLAVRRAVLLHGRVHLCPSGTLDYNYIKCYLFHVFERPDQYSAEQIREKTREFFDAPELIACLHLAPNKDKFMREYLDALCGDFTRIFIEGDSAHNPKLMGLSMGTKNSSRYALPGAQIIRGILTSPNLSEDESLLLAGRFYRAMYAIMRGLTEPLDSALGEQICQKLA